MSQPFLSLLLAATLGLSAAAQEAVARVQSIQPADGSGKSELRRKRAVDSQAYPVTVNATGYVQDHFTTDANTLAALEFLIGGRVSINKSTDIEIVNERSVADGKTDVKRLILKNGSLWVKADAKALKQPLEIQTHGGVMGIKGTEFTVDQQEDGNIRVCCFESNSEQGGVELRDHQGVLVGLARPGDEVRFGRNLAPLFRHFDDLRKFRDSILNEPVFRQLHETRYFARQLMGDLGTYPPIEGARAYQSALLAQNIQRNPALAWAQRGQQLKTQMRDLRQNLRQQLSALKNPPAEAAAPGFPSQLSPDSSANSTQLRQSGAFPTFSWQGVEGATAYVLVLGRDEALNDVIYTTRTEGCQHAYPAQMRPLEQGTYTWRVIPVDDQDHPVQQPSQTFFQVVGSPGG